MASRTDFAGLRRPFKPDYRGLVDNILRKGTPDRVYHIELFLDGEIQEAIAKRFGIGAGLDQSDPHYAQKLLIALYRFLGYDAVGAGVEGIALDFKWSRTKDTSALERKDGRNWIEEGKGVLTTWEDFEKYPWPDPRSLRTDTLEWYSANLPDDMCIVGRGGHWCEYLCWLMGYESLCYAIYDQRDLVEAIYKKVVDIELATINALMSFDRLRIMWASDDMGFKTGPMLSPKHMREFVLSGHKMLAQIAHKAGRPYILHACGKRAEIIDDLIDDVKIDAIHSWEDTIELVTDAKRQYGKRLSLLGGIDLDFLCRSGEKDIRRRVRETLDVCQPGGGYCLGTGNSVANYIPLDSYLTMVDEGRLYA